MKKIITIVLLFSLLFTGCSFSSKTDNLEKLNNLPCKETIAKQLDALIVGGDIGYSFDSVDCIFPYDLGAYIGYRGVEMLEKSDGEFLSEEECLNVLRSDFGIDYIPFKYEESDEKVICSPNGNFKGKYSIVDIEESDNKISVTVNIEIPILSTTEFAFDEKAKSYLQQKVNYEFEVDGEKSIIKSAEIITE